MRINRLTRILTLSVALALSASTATVDVSAKGGSGIESLTRKLKSDDFRMQVQAALILGKTGDARALPALAAALKDKSTAVRAASAAALGTLGDPAALPALRRSQSDSSAAVKRRILATITALENIQRTQLTERRRAKILVKFDKFESSTAGDSVAALGAAAQASRKELGKHPDIAILNATEDPRTASKRHKRPVVMVRASLRRLSASREGSNTVVSADVEFLVERFPNRAIMGRLSGNASVKSEVDSRRARLALQEEAVDAAVSSALKKSQQALLAAADRG